MWSPACMVLMLSPSLQPGWLRFQLSETKKGSSIQICTSQNTLCSTRAQCHSPFERVRQIIPILLKGSFAHRWLKKFKVQGRSLHCHSCCSTTWKVCIATMILMTENFSLLVRLLEDKPSWQFCLLALVECKNYISVHNGSESIWGNTGLPRFMLLFFQSAIHRIRRTGILSKRGTGLEAMFSFRGDFFWHTEISFLSLKKKS